jgi:hypothetical protein
MPPGCAPGSLSGEQRFGSFGGKLVGGLEPWNFMTFHNIWDVILPIDELHHFSEGLVETTNQ